MSGQFNGLDPQNLNAQGEVSDSTMSFSGDFMIRLDNEARHDGISSDEAEAIKSLPSGSALLLVRRGPNAGARFLLDSDVSSVGRHPHADILLDDVTVSRKHAQFKRSGTTFSVRDRGSLNGTYLNGERVDEAVLHDGDEVQVGKYRLTFFASRHDNIPVVEH